MDSNESESAKPLRYLFRPNVDGSDAELQDQIEAWLDRVLGYHDPQHQVQEGDLLDTGSQEQDDFDPETLEWAGVTSGWDPRTRRRTGP